MGSLKYNLNISKKDATRNYVWKDIADDILSSPPSNRDIKVSLDYRAIQNGLENIFLFRQGERILVPEFGNTLYKYLYEPINEHTSKKIGIDIQTMINRWEPRVDIQRLVITPLIDQNEYDITMIYTVPSLSVTNTLTWNKSLNMRR